MTDNQALLSELERLLAWKKSKKFMADKLQISENEVNDLLKELRSKGDIGESLNDAVELCEAVKKVNNEKGTIESTIVVDFEPKDDMMAYSRCPSLGCLKTSSMASRLSLVPI